MEAKARPPSPPVSRSRHTVHQGGKKSSSTVWPLPRALEKTPVSSFIAHILSVFQLLPPRVGGLATRKQHHCSVRRCRRFPTLQQTWHKQIKKKENGAAKEKVLDLRFYQRFGIPLDVARMWAQYGVVSKRANGTRWSAGPLNAPRYQCQWDNPIIHTTHAEHKLTLQAGCLRANNMFHEVMWHHVSSDFTSVLTPTSLTIRDVEAEESQARHTL